MRLRRSFSALFAAALAAALSGCVAIPPAITLASLGVDLGSFALTGKTASDHVLSAVAGEDCRLAGALEGEICREDQEFEAALAVLEPLPGDARVAAAGPAPDERQLASNASSGDAPPPGFTVPSGAVVTEDAKKPEPAIGGFSFGDGKSRGLPEDLGAAIKSSQTETPDIAGYLSDESLPRVSQASARRRLAERLDSATFLSQSSPLIGPDS